MNLRNILIIFFLINSILSIPTLHSSVNEAIEPRPRIFTTLVTNNWVPHIETFRNQSSPGLSIQMPAIALGTNNHILVSWAEEITTNDPEIFFGERTASGNWFIEQVSNLNGGNSESQITVDFNNTPHIIWRNNFAGFTYVKYATKVDGNWQIETVSNQSIPESHFGTIMIDQQNHPHVYWREGDRFTKYDIFHAEKISGAWITSHVITIDKSKNPEYFRILEDTNGTTYLFWKEDFGDYLVFMMFNGTTWTTPTNFASGNTIRNYDVAFTDQNKPIVAFGRDGGAGTRNLEIWEIDSFGNWFMTPVDSPYDSNDYVGIDIDPWGNLSLQWRALHNNNYYWLIGHGYGNLWMYQVLDSGPHEFKGSNKATTLVTDEKGIVHSVMSRISLQNENSLQYCRVDMITPFVNIISPLNQTYFHPNQFVYNMWDNDEITNVTFYLNNIEISISNNSILTDLGDGSYNLTIEVLDGSGTRGKDEVFFTRKTTHTGYFQWNTTEYHEEDYASLVLIDPDLNKNSSNIEGIEIAINSSSDKSGFSILLRETGKDSGEFQGIIQFWKGASNEGHSILQVLSGDAVTAIYSDPQNEDGNPEIIVSEIKIVPPTTSTVPPTTLTETSGLPTLDIDVLYALFVLMIITHLRRRGRRNIK